MVINDDIFSLGWSIPLSVHVNTTFGFVNQNELIPMEAKSVHVNVASVSAMDALQ